MNTQNDLDLTEWQPEQLLIKTSANEARLSRGFLRSSPEKWFPGFAMQWLPLIYSCGKEIKLRSVKPLPAAPADLEVGFVGSIDAEPIALLASQASGKVLFEAFCPEALANQSYSILLEYLARRLLKSLAISWSGPESSVVVFEGELGRQRLNTAGAVMLEFSVDNNPCQVWLLLGPVLVDKLDGLWRRQLRSSARQTTGKNVISLEIAQLAVPPSLLADYLKPQAVIDLETVVTDKVTVRVDGKASHLMRLRNVEGKFGFEGIDDVLPNPIMPEGTTRIGIEVARFVLDPNQLAEISQTASIFESEIKLSKRVNLVINNEKVGQADLMVYEGRFAMRVA